MATKENSLTKMVSDAVGAMLAQPQKGHSLDGAMFCIRRVANGYLVSIVLVDSTTTTMLVYTDWQEMMTEIHRMMHAELKEGH